MTTTQLSYGGSPLTVRDDLVAAHRRTWEHIARPGTWNGAERFAIAAETCNAASVIDAFSMNTRIANATVIPLDESTRDAREAIATRLGVQRHLE